MIKKNQIFPFDYDDSEEEKIDTRRASPKKHKSNSDSNQDSSNSQFMVYQGNLFKDDLVGAAKDGDILEN